MIALTDVVTLLLLVAACRIVYNWLRLALH